VQVPTLTSLAPFLYFPSFVIHLPTKHVGVTFLRNSFKSVRAFQIELEFWSVGFWGEGPKTRVPGKTSRRREPTTNSTHIWRRRGDLKHGHNGGRPAWLSPLRQPRPIWFLRYYMAFIWDSPEAPIFFSQSTKSGGSIYFVAFILVGYCLGSRTLHGLSTHICYCIVHIVRNSALHHILWTKLPVYRNWYLHLKVADQHSRSLVW